MRRKPRNHTGQQKGSSEIIGHQQQPASEPQGLLSALPEHLFTSLFGRATIVRCGAEELLFLAGEVGDGCYLVKDGLLKVTMMSSSGSERILAFLGPGAVVGELSVIDTLPRSASVIAVQNSVLRFLSRANFEDFAKKRPEVYKSLVTLLAARLRETDVTIAAETFLPLRGRVACALLELAHEFGKDLGSGRVLIQQKIGQSDLAAMAGIARESVNRILNDWKRRQLVSRHSGYYWIEDKARLQKEAEV
jgi:CRP/FNR family transcriptional regulator, cyclic AMP receptor protein